MTELDHYKKALKLACEALSEDFIKPLPLVEPDKIKIERGAKKYEKYFLKQSTTAVSK